MKYSQTREKRCNKIIGGKIMIRCLVIFVTVLCVFYSSSAYAGFCVGGVCSGQKCDKYYHQQRGGDPYTFLTCIPTKNAYQDRDCSKEKGCVYVSTSTPIPAKSIYYVDVDSLTGIDDTCKVLLEPETKSVEASDDLNETGIVRYVKGFAQYFKRVVNKVNTDIGKIHTDIETAENCTQACNIWCNSIKGARGGEAVSAHLEQQPYVACSCQYID